MSMTDASKNYFEKVAGTWDELRKEYFDEAIRETAITKAYLRPEMVVADVGSGTGFMAVGLAPLVHEVIVLDGSPAMLAAARKNLGKFSNVLYQEAVGGALPLPDSHVDAVFANMYLHHSPDPLVAIQEMVRILKPGGRLMITDLDEHSHTWMKEEMADEWLGFNRSQVTAWLEQAGLVNVLVGCTGESCCAESSSSQDSPAGDRMARISVFFAAGTRRLRMRNQVEAAYAAAIQGGCGCEGNTSAASAACCESSSATCCAELIIPLQDDTYATPYSAEDWAVVPAEAGIVSFGCGNPLALAHLHPGEVVLDIGSGGGMDSFLAAARVGSAGRVIGVDMTPAMLERARSTAEKAGVTNVEFRQGQAESLPVEDRSVDVVLSNCVINLCEDKGRVFNEAFRVLKPGGRLEVSDVLAAGSLPLDARLDAAAWAGCDSGALPEGEYLDLISQAGFSDLAVHRSRAGRQIGGVALYSAIVSASKGMDSEQPGGCCNE